jgi:hypothetical protein
MAIEIYFAAALPWKNLAKKILELRKVVFTRRI